LKHASEMTMDDIQHEANDEYWEARADHGGDTAHGLAAAESVYRDRLREMKEWQAEQEAK